MKAGIFPKPYADTVARLRVPAGFVLAAAFVWLSSPSPPSLILGLILSVLGLALRAWAAGHLAKNESLAETGPYAFVRNPLYIGTLIAALGLVIAGRSVILLAVFLAVFLLVYLPVIELEEQHLRKLFPAYDAYARRVPALRPLLRPAGPVGRFRPRLYWRNQEYNALFALAIAAIVLIVKLIY